MTTGLRGESPRRALVTVRSSREIDELFQQGARSADDLLTVFAADSPSEYSDTGRIAFIAGKKLGGAVARNRSKRVLRETARSAGGPWPGKDVMLVARPATRVSSPEDLERSLLRHLRRLEVVT